MLRQEVLIVGDDRHIGRAILPAHGMNGQSSPIVIAKESANLGPSS
jgi:hypothetical protein